MICKLKWIAVVALGLGAGPVVGQDLIFDMRQTLACLDAAAGAGAARNCIGASADACINATDMGGTTVGMGGCIDKELAYWDGRLNASYRELRARDRAEDADFGNSAGYVNQANALRDMQRAWIGWRDATCDYERAQWGGGTGGGPALLGCLMRLTGGQALYLERMMVKY